MVIWNGFENRYDGMNQKCQEYFIFLSLCNICNMLDLSKTFLFFPVRVDCVLCLQMYLPAW